MQRCLHDPSVMFEIDLGAVWKDERNHIVGGDDVRHALHPNRKWGGQVKQLDAGNAPDP